MMATTRRAVWGTAAAFMVLAGACTSLIGIDGEYTQSGRDGSREAGTADGEDGSAEAETSTGDSPAESYIDVRSDARHDALPDVPADTLPDVPADTLPDVPADTFPDVPAEACPLGETLCGGACVNLGSNGSHCGQCGHHCCGGQCLLSKCQRFDLVSTVGLGSPVSVAVDATHVYIVLRDKGYIAKAPKATPSSPDAGVELLASNQSLPEDITVRGDYVYWTDYGHPAAGLTGDAVMRTRIDGTGAPTTVASSQVGAHGIAVDDTHVYWTLRVFTTGRVRRCPLGGGTIDEIASGQNVPKRIQLTASHAYWTNIGGGQIMQATLADGGVLALVPDAANAHFLAVGPERVYWDEFADDGKVNMVWLDGGSPSVLAPSQPNAAGIAADDRAVYWATAGVPSGQGAIMKAHLDGTPPAVQLAPENDQPFSLAIDDTCVYWAASTVTTVRVVAKQPDIHDGY
jgi:hypothetical protein